LPRPFIVIATQNSIEMNGVFPLLKAQLVEFFVKLEMVSFDRDPLITLLKRVGAINKEFKRHKPIINVDDIISFSNEIDEAYFDDDILKCII